jgi:hypothetical protein
MAIVQVSRITQRKGLEQDLPQPLAGAELGWAVDQRRLFIGNGTLTEGAPVVGNTEILTEFSDILGFAATYTYQGEAAGYTVQTGVTSGTPVSQSLQSRLDSYAIVSDFGATGDGVTDDTAAINRALFQLYCVQANSQIRRSLFFPAGTYKVSDTIKIPPYAKLYGEGANSSIISFQVEIWAANTAYADGVLVSDEDPGTGVITYYRSVAAVPGTGILLTDADYWDSVNLPNYVVQTADSLQQTGVNLGQNGATLPRNVEVSSMAFETQTFGNDSALGHQIMLLEQARQFYFDSVTWRGPLLTSQLDSAVENLAAVRFAGTLATPPTQITFDKCRFQNLTFAINTDELIQGITISNSWFDSLYQGILLGDNAPVNGGPTGVRVMHNIFDNIYAEAVVIENCSLNATGYNTFLDVGNQFNGAANPATPIITINANNNLSVGDMFLRTTAQSLQGTGYPRIRIFDSGTASTPTAIGITSGSQIQLGNYVRESGVQVTLEDGFADQALFTFDTALAQSNGGFQALRMDYTIYRLTAGTKAVRTGSFTVVAGGDDSAGEGVVFVDDYTENEGTDIDLSATESSDVVTVSYTAAATGFDGTIYYSITHLA